MILQARREKAVREVLVIAAGLSIQDPRERPLDRQAAADAAHRRFAHPDSDFLTLLNIWNTLHDEFERLTQGRLRRWCHDHFLSYTRLREWRDIYHQLLDTLEERKDFRLTSVFDGQPAAATGSDEQAALRFGGPAYRAIHRSILAGLLGNIALRDDEKGGYKATHDRRVTLFPGSVLFRREEKQKRSAPTGAKRAGADTRAPRWVMASEIVETSRLYARTCARLDPTWVLDLGQHLLKVSHSEPFWEESKGRVLVRQRTRLYGLEVDVRSVSYGRIDPAHATEIFIREALVNDTVTWPFDFLAHNRAVRAEVESQLTRARDSGYLNLDEAVYRFYADKLGLESSAGADVPHPVVSSVAELTDLVRERKTEDPHFLEFQPEDLRDPEEVPVDPNAFPPAVPVENLVLPLTYSYRPGEPDDGVTLEVPVTEAENLTPAMLDWAVPGHLAAKVEHLLRALPKELRRALLPLGETSRQLTRQLESRDRLTGRRESLVEALAAVLGERFQLRIDPAIWADKPLPDHLRVRVRVTDREGRELAASRELAEVHAAVADRVREASRSVGREDPVVWRRAREQWESPERDSWPPREEIPSEITIGQQAGVPLMAFPALDVRAKGVALRLFRTREDAEARWNDGLRALLREALRYDLAWFDKDLRALRDVGPLAATLAPVATLQAQASQTVAAWVTSPGRVPEQEGRRTARQFNDAVERAKTDLRGLVPRLVDLLKEILALRQALLVEQHPYPGLGDDLAALLPADFLVRVPYDRLPHLPRYLKAMQLRATRWRQNPAKDAERARQLAPYVAAVAKLPSGPDSENVRWLVEELRVSLFAQELGTSEPVSTVKLDRVLSGLRSKPAAAASSETTAEPSREPVRPSPVMIGPASGKKKPLKSLGSLESLFGRK